MKMLSDEILCIVAKAKTGDREAFGLLYDQYWRYVLCFARRKFLNEEDALDFVQSLFLLIMTKLPGLKKDELFFRWFRTTMKRHFLNQLRVILRQRSRVCFFSDKKDSQFLASIDDRGPAAIELAEYLAKGMVNLSEGDIVILKLYYHGGAKTDEISISLGVPLGTVKRRLHDARNRLRTQLVMS